MLKDKNGVVIECGMDIEIPEPTNSDMWNFDFVGTVDSIDEKTKLITVVDGDGDYFQIESHRSEIYYE